MHLSLILSEWLGVTSLSLYKAHGILKEFFYPSPPFNWLFTWLPLADRSTGLGVGLTASGPLGQGLPNPPGLRRGGLDQHLHQPQPCNQQVVEGTDTRFLSNLDFLRAVLNISPSRKGGIHLGPPNVSSLHLYYLKHVSPSVSKLFLQGPMEKASATLDIKY